MIQIHHPHRNPREGWADDAERLMSHGDEKPLWPEFANPGDEALIW